MTHHPVDLKFGHVAIAFSYAIMSDCWHLLPEKRPVFGYLRSSLATILEHRSYLYGYLNPTEHYRRPSFESGSPWRKQFHGCLINLLLTVASVLYDVHVMPLANVQKGFYDRQSASYAWENSFGSAVSAETLSDKTFRKMRVLSSTT